MGRTAVVGALTILAVGCGVPDEARSDVESRQGALGTFNVWTRSYNNQRTGANVSESILTPATVNAAGFGKLFQLAVDDQVYAQPLYLSGVSIPNKGVHNVVYIATVNNTVYAFDADTGGAPLWRQPFNFNGGHAPSKTEVAHGQACGGGYRDFSGKIGIVGTPVIDTSTLTMYFITRTVEGAGLTQMVYRRVAIDVRTGDHKFNSPQPLFAGGTQPAAFDPWFHNQRAGLGLSQGKVYVAFAAYCDTGPYHGWVIAFNAANVAQAATFLNVTPHASPEGDPNGVGKSMGGIWQAGSAPAIDGKGFVYVTTGNGYYNQQSQDWGQTLLKLKPGTLGYEDNFTPSNVDRLNGDGADMDFGSAGPSLLPGSTQVVSGGKDGRIYLRPTTNMGHLADIDIAGFQAVDPDGVRNLTHHIHNGVVLWTGPTGLNLYVWGENDFLRLYSFNPRTQTFNKPALAVGSILPPNGMPGGIMALSADGSKAGTGILWATTPSQGNANNQVRPGILRAFNAETLALLWESTSPGDDIMELSKFNPPLVANGKVYVASFSGVVSVFGTRSGPTPPVVNATYQIRTMVADKCIDVANSGTADRVNVQQWACNGTNAQRWQITQTANNVYQVRSVISGKCLNVDGGAAGDFTNVDQFTCDGSAKQQWAIVPLGNAQYRLMPKTAANRCLDVNNSGTGDGTNIQQFTCNGTAAQAFQLAIDNTGSGPIPSQTYRLRTVVAPNSCVDVSNSDQGNGDNIQEWGCNGTDAQRWRFKNLGSGIYEIRTAVSDFCMDVDNSGTADGTNVRPYDCNGSNAQRWLVQAMGEGQFQLKPQVSTTTCLDVSNSGTADGTNIQEWTCNGSSAQRFRVLAP
jgi:hypothetical protein